jgi:hypothetical protein
MALTIQLKDADWLGSKHILVLSARNMSLAKTQIKSEVMENDIPSKWKPKASRSSHAYI